MISELKSVRDVWKKMPTERHARLFERTPSGAMVGSVHIAAA